MRLLISGGGTGGHVYPALAVLAQVEAVAGSSTGADLETSLLWVGSEDGVEASLVSQAGITFTGIATGQLRGKNPLTSLRNVARIGVGVRQALRIISEFRPDCCFVTGGYVCAPVTIACRMMNIPILVYLPDMTPGLAVRLLSRLATRVAVSFEEVARFFGDKSVVTGYPVRPRLLAAATQRDASRRLIRERFGVEDDLPLLLVFGGSLGARSINRAIWSSLVDLLAHTQILHIIGTRDFTLLKEEMPELPETLSARYHAVDYLDDEMADALIASDLVIARAGASTLGEFPIASLPSILVPLPIAGGHQGENAMKLVDAGAARIVADEDLSQRLLPVMVELLENEELRQDMSRAAASLARPDAGQNIARELVRLSRVSPDRFWDEQYA